MPPGSISSFTVELEDDLAIATKGDFLEVSDILSDDIISIDQYDSIVERASARAHVRGDRVERKRWKYESLKLGS